MIVSFVMTHQLTDFSLWSWILGYHRQRSQQTAGVQRWRTWKWAFPNAADFPLWLPTQWRYNLLCVRGFAPTAGSPTFVIGSCLCGCQLYKLQSFLPLLCSEPSMQKHQGTNMSSVHLTVAANSKPTIDTFSTCLTFSTMMCLIAAAAWNSCRKWLVCWSFIFCWLIF